MAANEATPQHTSTTSNNAGIENLKVLENIEVKLTVEVGSTEMKIKDLLKLNEGSVVELERLAGAYVMERWGFVKLSWMGMPAVKHCQI